MNRRAFFQPRPARSPAVPAPPPLKPLAIGAGLEPVTQSLDRRQAAHLLRRVGFGVPPARLTALIGQPADAVVDGIVDDAQAVAPPPKPSWADLLPPPRSASDAERMQFNNDNRAWYNQYRRDWLARMAKVGLRERMTLFWSNHFVTGIQTYNLAAYAYRYVTLLRTHALGNFKTFVREVGTTPAMLLYLNGVQNRVGAPNENYARELLELFTMGQYRANGSRNYTQEDIQEIARALTGWVINNSDLSPLFLRTRHDDDIKTFFGRTGRFGYDDVVDVLFEERGEAIAEFVCAELYKEFVYAAPDPAIVAGLAATFIASGFEIAPVVRQILKSAHFFDEQVGGARIKSPIELLVGAANELGLSLTGDGMAPVDRAIAGMEQVLLNPPNVAGWPGHRSWLNTTTLPLRWVNTEVFVVGTRQAPGANIVPLAEQLTDPTWDADGKKLSPFYLPLALAEYFLSVSPAAAAIEPASEPFAGDLARFPIPDEVVHGPAHVQHLAKIFLVGTPWYEWNLHSEGAAKVLQNFARYLTQLPEYQLA